MYSSSSNSSSKPGSTTSISVDSYKSGNASFIASDIAKSQEGRAATEAEIESWRRSVEENFSLSSKKSSDVVENKNDNNPISSNSNNGAIQVDYFVSPELLCWYDGNSGNDVHSSYEDPSIKGTGKDDYFDKYPKAYIDGIIKAYETHKKVNGRFVLDNGGQTIGYGHDLLPGENFSGGLSKQEALDLLIKDLDKKYDSIGGYIKALNSKYGYNIDINDFSENEKMFLVDFVGELVLWNVLN